jgi:hypothetical protein
MTIRKASLIGGIIAAVVCIGLQTAPAFAATSSNTPAAPPIALPVAASAQVSHEAAVGTFLAAHPKPATLTASASAAELTQNRTAWYSYLKAAPWTDIFGQWGCTVSNLNVIMSKADDGNAYPTVQDVANCGGVEALTGIVGTIDTKASVLAQPANAQLRTALTATSSSDAVASPLAVAKHCANVSATYLCILWDYSNGLIGASAQWEGSSSTYGHVRLGGTTGQPWRVGIVRSQRS